MRTPPTSTAERSRRGHPGRAGPALAALLGLLLFACGGEAVRPPNVLLVTLDTTRADRLSVYGHARPTTPVLEALALDSILHTRAYSVSNWTLPAHASLFTGAHVKSHGARYDADGDVVLSDAIVGPGHYAQYRARRLGAGLPTLAEELERAGWATAAVVAGPWMKRVFGLDRGFTHYDDREIDAMHGRLAESVSDAALAWLARHSVRSPAQPFFLFLNYYDPHGPYGDPAGHGVRFGGGPAALEAAAGDAQAVLEVVRADYDGEIRYADEQLGRVLDALRSDGQLDRTWVIVTADHGELLGEHARIGHGHSLFQPELRIPLIVRPPGAARAGTRDDLPIQLHALAPRLLEALGLPVPAPMGSAGGAGSAGGSGRATPLGDAGTATPPVLADAGLPTGLAASRWKAWIEGPHKLIRHGNGRRQLFQLDEDPGESTDLHARQPALARRLEAAMQRYEQALPAAPEATAGELRVDEETRRALRELGYLDSENGS